MCTCFSFFDKKNTTALYQEMRENLKNKNKKKKEKERKNTLTSTLTKHRTQNLLFFSSFAIYIKKWNLELKQKNKKKSFYQF